MQKSFNRSRHSSSKDLTPIVDTSRESIHCFTRRLVYHRRISSIDNIMITMPISILLIILTSKIVGFGIWKTAMIFMKKNASSKSYNVSFSSARSWVIFIEHEAVTVNGERYHKMLGWFFWHLWDIWTSINSDFNKTVLHTTETRIYDNPCREVSEEVNLSTRFRELTSFEFFFWGDISNRRSII